MRKGGLSHVFAFVQSDLGFYFLLHLQTTGFVVQCQALLCRENSYSLMTSA